MEETNEPQLTAQEIAEALEQRRLNQFRKDLAKLGFRSCSHNPFSCDDKKRGLFG